VLGIGLPEFAVILVVAILVFGPDKLPEFARQAGRLLRRLRQFTDAARDDIRNELGPEYADLELSDLDPRQIVRKHVLEAMEDDEPTARPSRPGQRPLREGERPPYDSDAT
jgi:sec-independent protein translocase protein TatB